MKSRLHSFHARRTFVVLAMVGALLHTLYQLLKALEIGNIGEPSDIGGGLILLFGYLLLGAAVMGLFVDFVRGRSEQRDLSS